MKIKPYELFRLSFAFCCLDNDVVLCSQAFIRVFLTSCCLRTSTCVRIKKNGAQIKDLYNILFMAIADTTMERYGNDGEQALRGYPRDTDVCIGIPFSEMQQHDGTSKYHNLLEMNKVRFLVALAA